MPAPIALAAAADDDFALGAGVMLHSALAHLPAEQPVHVFLIDDGMRAGRKQRILRILRAAEQPVQVRWLDEAGRLPEGLKTDWWIPEAAYLRLLLPEWVPARYDRLIYLDADVIVETDLRRLWNEEMGGHALLAVQGFGVQRVSHDKGLALYERLGLPPDAPYFNSGVLVMNLARWREEQISEKIFHYLQKHREHVNLHDQDGMNAVLAGDWKRLDPRWNQQSKIHRLGEWGDSPLKRELQASQVVEQPYIIHFTSVPKPWEPLCEHPARPRFLRYLRESAWFTPLEWQAWRTGRVLQRPAQWARKNIRPFYHRIRTSLSNG